MFKIKIVNEEVGGVDDFTFVSLPFCPKWMLSLLAQSEARLSSSRSFDTGVRPLGSKVGGMHVCMYQKVNNTCHVRVYVCYVQSLEPFLCLV